MSVRAVAPAAGRAEFAVCAGELVAESVDFGGELSVTTVSGLQALLLAAFAPLLQPATADHGRRWRHAVHYLRTRDISPDQVPSDLNLET